MTAEGAPPGPPGVGLSRSPFGIFRNPDFSRLWTAQLITEMGSSITALASSIYVYRITGSALNVGLMMMASMLPSLLVGLIAGVFVDRVDRKRIMVYADLIRFFLIIAIPFLIPVSVAWLYILVVLSAAVGQFFNPAHASVLPEVASEEELSAANAMMAISNFGSLALGYAIAGFIASRLPIQWAFFIDALTFAASALLVSRVRIRPVEVNDKTTVGAVIANLRLGIRHIVQTSILRSTFVVFVVLFVTFGLANALRLPFTLQILKADEFAFSIIESVTVVGFVIANLLLARFGDRLREAQWLTISFLGMGITSVAFGLNSFLFLALLISAFEGFLNAPSVVARSLIIQRNTPREMRGRAFSAFFVMRDTSFSLGMAVAGLGDLLDIRAMYIVSGIAVLGFGLLTLVLPGLGQPAAEWRRALKLLRTVPEAPGVGLGRMLTPADFDRLARQVPTLARITQDRRARLSRNFTLHEVPAGTAILRQGDSSDAAYFILDGKAVAGRQAEGEFRVLEVLRAGDFFGEIAALTGVPRTASVMADEPSTLVRVDAKTLKEMADDPELNKVLNAKMAERQARMRVFDVGGSNRYDQNALRELRTVPESPPAT